MTMQPQRYDLTIVQGTTFYLPFAIDAPDGTTYDLAAEGDGYTIGLAQVRTAPLSEGGELLLDLTTANGGIVIAPFTDGNGLDWSGYLFATAATTAMLVPWGEAVWNLEISDGVRVEHPLFGVAQLFPEVTGS
jgi:hypothetical protein